MNFIKSLYCDEVLQAKENDEVLFLSERSQAISSDCLPPGTYMRLPMKIDFNLHQNDLSGLKAIWSG